MICVNTMGDRESLVRDNWTRLGDARVLEASPIPKQE